MITFRMLKGLAVKTFVTMLEKRSEANGNNLTAFVELSWKRAVCRYHEAELQLFFWQKPGTYAEVCVVDLLTAEKFCCDGFAWIQEAKIHKSGSRSPNSHHNLFLVQIRLWKVPWSLILVQPRTQSLSIVVWDSVSFAYVTIWTSRKFNRLIFGIFFYQSSSLFRHFVFLFFLTLSYEY